jgi:hypothetical protein
VLPLLVFWWSKVKFLSLAKMELNTKNGALNSAAASTALNAIRSLMVML